jgi:feruloyl esterase
MAQRFPADYDGVVSVVPVISWVGLQVAGNRSGIVQQNGGWLPATKVAVLRKAVVTACDNIDGLEDGIISNYEKCGSVFSTATLRCPSNQESDTCLTNAQLAAVDVLHSPYQFKFSLANGVMAYPGFGYGGEDQPGGASQWVWGAKPAAFPAPQGSGQGQAWYYGNGAIRFFIVRDPKFNPLEFSPDAHAERMRNISGLMDSTNPDLSAFAARGGKLIMKENMADYAQSPFAGIGYYKSVVERMGQPVVDRFFRLYVAPGANHGGRGVSGTSGAPIPQYVDLLSILDAWVDMGQAPSDAPIQTTQDPTAPFAVTAARPMCRYPRFPRYIGSGNPNSASSFTCVAP